SRTRGLPEFGNLLSGPSRIYPTWAKREGSNASAIRRNQPAQAVVPFCHIGDLIARCGVLAIVPAPIIADFRRVNHEESPPNHRSRADCFGAMRCATHSDCLLLFSRST